MDASYARVSTEDQAKNGYSINDQLRQNRQKAGTEAEIKEYVDDGYSGEFLDRPALTQLRQDIKDGLIHRVIVYDPDRLSRKLMNQLIVTEEFEKRGVELIFVNGEYAKTPEGQLFYSMRGAIAEYEKAKINERMSRGRREKARQGFVVKDPKIYGYEFDKEEQQLIINEREAVVVRLIFDLWTGAKRMPGVQGMNTIAKYLTDHGVPTKMGKGIWHRNVVRQLLLQDTYIGIFYQNKWNSEGMLGNKFRAPEDRVPMRMRPKEEWIPVDCPPIIDKEQFDHAQKLLGEAKRRFTKDSNHQYLLSGLMRCGVCGNTITGRRHNNWGMKVPIYTDLKNSAGAKVRGCGKRWNCSDLDDYVWNAVHNWLNQPDEIAAASALADAPTSSFEQAEIDRLTKELEKTKAGRKRLLNLFADGDADLGEEDIRQKLRELKEKEERISEQLENLKSVVYQQQNFEYTMNVVKEAAEYYLQRASEDLTFEDKKELIRLVVREVRVFPDKIEIYSF